MRHFTKRSIALLLALAMSLSLLSATAWATNVVDELTGTQPTPATEQDDGTSAEDNDNTADQAETEEPPETDPAPAEDDETEPQTAAVQQDTSVTVNTGDIQFSFDGANAALAASLVADVKVDPTDPLIVAVSGELDSLEVAPPAESGATTAEGEETKTKLTDEQIQTVLKLFQNYQDHWAANANVLGVQIPFYLTFNDNGEDGLGVLGELLVLAGLTVDKIRDGDYSYDELTGLIMNFLYGDQYGVEYYGEKIADVREDALQFVKDSGAKTEAQKLLALNDYLAQINTFDMAFIMNQKEETMTAKEPTKNEHYDTIYDNLYATYKDSIETQFKAQIRQGILDNVRQQTKEQITAQLKEQKPDMTDEEIDEYFKNGDGKAQLDAAVADVEKNGMDLGEGTQSLDDIVDAQMDQPMEDLNGMTPNEAIPVYAKDAATKLTDGVMSYWKSTQVGAMALGSSVCLGYSRAYSYLVQCLHPEIYTTDGDYKTSSSWKSAKELYCDEDGNLDVENKTDYCVDFVRITYDADVKMYGVKQANFDSVHFWNAVKVDGKWYYVDACYNDIYTEVMTRDRAEANGCMNHIYFLFSDKTAKDLYKGNYSELKTLYEDKATDKSYEDAWFARDKSSTSYDSDGNAYYTYNSIDLYSMLDMNFDNMDPSDTGDIEDMLGNGECKLVKHAQTENDLGDGEENYGDRDYETLIFFNNDEDKDGTSVATVYNPKTDKMEENAELTEKYLEHTKQGKIYPSIYVSSYYYEGKIYFNLSNAIYTYDLSTGAVTQIKEYNTVYGQRDDSVVFGAMAFSTTTNADDADITVENAPIAGFTIKDDGKMYVSIATNYSWVSGRTEHDVYSADGGFSDAYDKSSYGYEFQETNYNPNYSSYASSAGYDSDEINDNDEFMWSATISDTLSMSHLTGSSHDYEKVSVEATCDHDAYTENRCATCGLIEADSRKIQKGTACEHHYVHYNETYYTGDTDNWKTGDCYVCTHCGYAVESTDDGTDEDWDASQDTYEMAKSKAGHTYSADSEDAVTWTPTEDGSYTASIAADSALTCETCKNLALDCLQSYEEAGKNLTSTTAEKLDLTVTPSTTGNCVDGLRKVYTATSDITGGKIVAVKTESVDAGSSHSYVYKDNGNGTHTCTCSVCGEETVEDCTYKDGVCTLCGAKIPFSSTTLELKSVANSTNGVTVSWNALDGATGYRVYRKGPGDKSWTYVTKNTTKTSITDTEVKAGVTYRYTVRGFQGDPADKSTPFSKYNKTGLTIKYLSKVTISSLANASSGITVKWSKATGASGYKVYRQTGSSSKWSTVATIKSGSTVSWTDTKTSNGTKYTYSVRAYSGDSMSVRGSSIGLTKVLYRLSKPSISSLKNYSSKKMTVKWGKNSKATGYQIQYSTSSKFSNAKTVTVKSYKTVSATITKLTKNKTYYVRVRAYKTVSKTTNYSTWSSTKSVKIKK